MTWKYFVGNRYHFFKSFKVYSAYKSMEAEEIKYKDFNESFTGQFLKSGFETFGIAFNESKPEFNVYNKKINPSVNWFGTSIQSPDTIFKKDDVELLMSLQGWLAPYNEKYDTLFTECSVKYICVKKSGQKLYEDWTGNLPSKELINTLI